MSSGRLDPWARVRPQRISSRLPESPTAGRRCVRGAAGWGGWRVAGAHAHVDEHMSGAIERLGACPDGRVDVGERTSAKRAPARTSPSAGPGARPARAKSLEQAVWQGLLEQIGTVPSCARWRAAGHGRRDFSTRSRTLLAPVEVEVGASPGQSRSPLHLTARGCSRSSFQCAVDAPARGKGCHPPALLIPRATEAWLSVATLTLAVIGRSA